MVLPTSKSTSKVSKFIPPKQNDTDEEKGISIGNAPSSHNNNYDAQNSNNDPSEECLSTKLIIWRHVRLVVPVMVCGVVIMLIPLRDPVSYLTPDHLLYIMFLISQNLMGGIVMIPLFSEAFFDKIGLVPYKVAIAVVLYVGGMIGGVVVSMVLNVFPIPFHAVIFTGISFLGCYTPLMFMSLRPDPIKTITTYLKTTGVIALSITWFVVCEGFLLVFYARDLVRYQFAWVIVLQMLLFGFKFSIRNYIASLGNHLELGPQRIADIKATFMYWLDCGNHIYLALIFPKVNDWGIVAFYIIGAILISIGQLVIDSDYVSDKIMWYLSEQKLKRLAGMFAMTNFDRVASLQIYYGYGFAKVMSSLVYLTVTPIIMYGYNTRYFPVFAHLSSESYMDSVIYALSSGGISILQIIISNIVLKRIYKLSLFQLVGQLWGRLPWLVFTLTINAIAICLVATLSHNNIITVAETYHST